MATVYVMVMGIQRGQPANGGSNATKDFRPQGMMLDIFAEEQGENSDFGLGMRMTSCLIMLVENFPYEAEDVRWQLVSRNEDDDTDHFRFVTDIPSFRGTFQSPDNAKGNRMLALGVESHMPGDIVTVDWPTHLEIDTVDNGGPRDENGDQIPPAVI